MPNLTDMNKYLKKADFTEGDKVMFVTPGELKEVDFSREKDGSNIKPVFQVDVSLNGGPTKTMTVNKTSSRDLTRAWGPKTENWVNKIAEVNFVKAQVFGKVDTVLCLTPKEEKAPPETDWPSEEQKL